LLKSSGSLAIFAAIRRASLYFPCPRFFWRLSPFPFAGLLIVASDTALGHFVAVFVARHDKCSENAATKAKRAERYDDDELQQLTHRNSSGSFAILTAIRLASSLLSSSR
jgi:hypothetical protein